MNTSTPIHTSAPAGSLSVVIAPSGAGKSSLVGELLKADDNILLSISHTTRAPRVGEVNGVAYHFTTTNEFLAKRDAGGFIEWAEVHGNYYGTSKDWIMSALTSGKDVLLEIDWQGAQQVRAHFPDMIGIFILPPSMEELSQRLHKRGTDSEEVIAKRLAAAKNEMAHADECEYVIINHLFSTALAQLQQIVGASRLRFASQKARYPEIFAQLVIPSPAAQPKE